MRDKYGRCTNREELDGLFKSWALEREKQLMLFHHVTQMFTNAYTGKLYELEWLVDQNIPLNGHHFEQGLMKVGPSPELILKVKGRGEWPSGVALRMLMFVSDHYLSWADQRAATVFLIDRIGKPADVITTNELITYALWNDAVGSLQAFFLDRQNFLSNNIDWPKAFQNVARFFSTKFLFENVPASVITPPIVSFAYASADRCPNGRDKSRMLALIAFYIDVGANNGERYSLCPTNAHMRTIANGGFFMGLESNELVEQTDGAGRTILFYALQYADLSIVKLLLEGSAPCPYVCDAAGFTAMQYAEKFQPDAVAMLAEYSRPSRRALKWLPASLRQRILTLLCCWKRVGLQRDVAWIAIGFYLMPLIERGFPSAIPNLDDIVRSQYPGMMWKTHDESVLDFAWSINAHAFSVVMPTFALEESPSGVSRVPSVTNHFTIEATIDYLGLKCGRLFFQTDQAGWPNRPTEFKQLSPSVMFDHVYSLSRRHVSAEMVLAVMAGCLKGKSMSPLSLLPVELVRRILQMAAEPWPVILPHTPGVARQIADHLFCGWQGDSVLLYQLEVPTWGVWIPKQEFVDVWMSAWNRFPIKAAADAERRMLELTMKCMGPPVSF